MIEPFMEAQKREGVISYGLSSYGYDARIADEFTIFTNLDSAAIDHRHWYSTQAAPDCTGGRNAIDATTTSSETVTTQTTMQYGHNAPMRYRL